MRWLATLSLASLCCVAYAATALAAEDEEEEGKTKCPEKSQYTLFNPTPANCLREFDPDRPDVTDSPFTVDAGHIQFESGLFSYALSRPDREGVVTEEFDILDTKIRLGITNYAEIVLDVPPLDIEHTDFLFLGSTHGSRDQVRWSFKPNSISMVTTPLRSGAQRRLV